MRQSQTNATTVNYSQEDLNYLSKTMWAEARSEGRLGMLHVGSVILNRVRDGRFRNTIKGVVLQPRQFSVWSPSNPNYRRIQSVTMDDPEYRVAVAGARQLLESGPINSYLYFEHRTLGRRGTLIGNHRFR